MCKRILMFLVLTIPSISMAAAESPKTHSKTDVYEGWKLGVQTWSFRKFTLFEAIDKTRSLGLDAIQAFPGQRVSKGMDVKFGPGLSNPQRQRVKDKLSEAGVSIVAFGVVNIPENEAGACELFEFVKDMGIGTIASEPKASQFDLIDKFCQEYKIKLAIHNHPKPSPYWNPDKVLAMCDGRSEWIGACADVGHWVRSGLDPIACLEKLKGRIHDVHIKEVDEDGNNMIFGEAQNHIEDVLKELHRQQYKGTFAIEYESNWDNNLPEIRKSVLYFNSVASRLNPSGWKWVFDNELSNAIFKENGWIVDDGVLTLKGGGDIWTKEKYSNFILDFEFKLDEQTNSGVFLRAGEHTWIPWVEVQIEDSFGKPVTKHICGGIFDIKEPVLNAVKPAGKWNRMTIIEKDSKVCIILNTKPVLDIDLNDWTEPGRNPDGTNNKFGVAYKDLPRTGWIGFQDHGQNVWYRNIKIKEL
ncbi:MAG: DUF1080 domain-containing protein [Planctomycetes bacterium]|nr:DUF1080 domain-containing protein [Planctomycetota bacterium]